MWVATSHVAIYFHTYFSAFSLFSSFFLPSHTQDIPLTMPQACSLFELHQNSAAIPNTTPAQNPTLYSLITWTFCLPSRVFRFCFRHQNGEKTAAWISGAAGQMGPEVQVYSQGNHDLHADRQTDRQRRRWQMQLCNHPSRMSEKHAGRLRFTTLFIKECRRNVTTKTFPQIQTIQAKKRTHVQQNEDNGVSHSQFVG